MNKIKNHVQYIGSNENDFIHIMGGKLDAGEKISENLCINFIKYQKECAAMLYAYFLGSIKAGIKIKVVDFENKNLSTDPGTCDFLQYLKFRDKAVNRLSDWKRGATVGNEDIYKKWINVMKEICDHVNGEEPA